MQAIFLKLRKYVFQKKLFLVIKEGIKIDKNIGYILIDIKLFLEQDLQPNTDLSF